jgi:DNA-binding transcriptional regulator PaaX
MNMKGIKGRQYGEIAKYMLLAVGLAGFVITVTTAPGTVLALKLFKFDKRQFPKKYNKQKVARTMQRLQKSELIRLRQRNGKVVVELTRKGRKKFQDIQLENLHITKPPKWDKKWRLVIFDIPDKLFKSGREALRSKLKEWEFYPLQKSVWVCPWPCEKEIEFIAELYEVGPYVNIVIAEKIHNDILARKHFGLS